MVKMHACTISYLDETLPVASMADKTRHETRARAASSATSALTVGEEGGRGLLVRRVHAADGVPSVLDAVYEVEVDRRRVNALRGKAGLARGGAAERRDLPDFAGASAHAEASGARAGGAGQHRGAGRKRGRASCSSRREGGGARGLRQGPPVALNV